MTREQYAITDIRNVRNLRSKLSEEELMHKLSFHFDLSLRAEILTQDIQMLEALLNLLAQWEDVMPSTSGAYTYNTDNASKPRHASETEIRHVRGKLRGYIY